MKFMDLLAYLSADPEVEKRNRELIEKKKAELGAKYAHHVKNHVTRKDGRVFSNSQIAAYESGNAEAARV